MPWQIPKDDLLAILKINDLSDESVKALSSVLAVAPMKHDIEEMTESIADAIQSIPYDELTSIIRVLDTLYHIREVTNVDLPLFIDDIADGVQYSDYDDIDLQKVEATSLKRKLEALLSIKTLKLISKSTIIQCDGERLYCESKILSDIRPIFDDDPSIIPSGAVITHTLKVIYHLGRDRQEFHVILNSEDLESLQEVITRAQMKEKTLKMLMKDANIDNLGR